MRRAFAFASLEQHLALVVSLVLLLCVSRLLGPGEIGLAAIGTGIATIAFTLRDFASPEFLVRRETVRDDDFRTAQTVQLLLGVAIAAGVWLLGGWFGSVYDAEGLAPFLAVLCIAGILEGVASPAQALLRRDLAFGDLATISASGVLTAAVVTLALAWSGWGYMSLAWGQAAGAAVKSLMTLRVGKARPAFRPSLGSWREALGFGRYYAGMTMVTRAYEALPQLLLGWNMPLSAAGFYNRATLVAGMPGRFLLAPVYAFALPALSAGVRDGQDMRAMYVRGLGYTSVLFCPALAMLAILAEPLVTLALGRGWDETVPVVRILAIGSMSLFPVVLTGPMLMASGLSRRAFLNCLVGRGSGAIIIFAASFHGLIAIAIGQAIAVQCSALVALWAARRYLDLTWKDLAEALGPSLVTTLATIAGPLALIATLGSSFSPGAMETVACILLAAAGWLLGLFAGRHPFRHEIRLGLRGIWAAAGHVVSATAR